MAKRKSLSKKVRFEVFKRDSFTCQYCGRSAPDVVLEVDHIQPVSKGGSDDVINLVTSCTSCNRGKSNKKLSDKTEIKKQKIMLDDLQKRREQLEMMAEWKNELLKLEQNTLNAINDYWSALLNNHYSLNGNGLTVVRKLLKTYPVDDVFEAIDIVFDNYIQLNDDLIPTRESVETAFNKLGGVLYIKTQQKTNPALAKIHYICGILKNRLDYFDRPVAMMLLKKGAELGIDLDHGIEIAKQISTWSEWRKSMEKFIAKYEVENE